MSQLNSAEQKAPEAVQKQKLNVYTVMLIISCLAILTSILLLYLELRQWGSPPWWSVTSASYSAQQDQPAWYPVHHAAFVSGDRVA